MRGKCIKLYKYNSEQVKEIVEVLEALLENFGAKEVSYEEFISFFGSGVTMEHNKTKFVVI